ncbi:MAG: hypothetical protein EBR81_12820 [Proteobacteria bacterium]|nr:hypothetical protein [Pseudomonadota bacterium]
MEHKAFMTQTLETSDALASPQVIQLALSAVQRYHAQCFWFRSPDAEVETVGDVLLVIQRLRQHGDLNAWKTAREIESCL